MFSGIVTSVPLLCVCAHVRARLCVLYLCLCMYECGYLCLYLWICVYMYACVCLSMCVCLGVSISGCMCLSVYLVFSLVKEKQESESDV